MCDCESYNKDIYIYICVCVWELCSHWMSFKQSFSSPNMVDVLEVASMPSVYQNLLGRLRLKKSPPTQTKKTQKTHTLSRQLPVASPTPGN